MQPTKQYTQDESFPDSDAFQQQIVYVYFHLMAHATKIKRGSNNRRLKLI